MIIDDCLSFNRQSTINNRQSKGYIGWPKPGGASTSAVPDFYTDNLLGEAMVLRPMVLMAASILKAPTLKEKYRPKAEEYIKLAEKIFEKWDSRGCWREVKDGGLWVVPPFGIDQQTGTWTDGYARRNTDGFSLPANKQNSIARWLIAMYDVTKKPLYKERAEKWWRHGGYYTIDVWGLVTAYEHGLVFTKEDIDRLIATNRDFMWNKKIEGAKFQRIDGGKPDKRWAKTPGVLWTALVPYDETLRKVFEANHEPASWGGLSATPWYLALHAGKRKSTKGVLSNENSLDTPVVTLELRIANSFSTRNS